MTFTDYWRGLSAADKQSLAKRVPTSPIYLFQIAGGQRKGSVEFSKKLAALTGLPLAAIRPDVWS